MKGTLDLLIKKFENADVIINLAGSPILKRWTRKNIKEIYNSRIETTKKLCKLMSLLKSRPSLFISASAVGIYNSTDIHTETSVGFADDFLGNVCRAWEKEAMEAEKYTRLVIFRFGIILGKKGGSFDKMIKPFRFFLGGRIAGGKQGFSWIHIKDVMEIFNFIINKPDTSGVFNVCSPNPVTNAEFTKCISKVLKRPTFFNVPGFILKIIYGKAAEVIIKGQKASPEKLLKAGFVFSFPETFKAIKDLCKRSS